MDIPPNFFDFPPHLSQPPLRGDTNNYGHLIQDYSAGNSGRLPQIHKPFESNNILPGIHKPLLMKPDAIFSQQASLLVPPLSGISPLLSSSSHHNNGCASSSEMERLLSGQVPVIKSKRYGGSDSNANINTNKSNHLDLNTKPGEDEESGESDGDFGTSSTSEDDDHEQEIKPKKGKPSPQNGFEFSSEKLQLYSGRFPCNFCSIVWNYAPELALHETNEHSKAIPENNQNSGKRRYHCARCSFNVFGRQRYINHHLKEHLGLEITPVERKSPKKFDVVDSFPCDICLTPLSKADSHAKRDHFRVYHNIKDVPPSSIQRCDECPAYFLQGIQLILHKQQFHGILANSSAWVDCPTCGKRCVGQFGLITHMASHDDTPDGQLECQICGEKLKSRLYFNRHMKRHLNQEQILDDGGIDGSFTCDQCGKIFAKKGLLDLHSEFHKDPNSWRFECGECGKKCSTKQSLQVHTRTHTGEKPFVCQVCGECFAYRHFLRWHVNQKHQQDGVEDNPRPYTKNSLPSHQSQKRKETKNTEFICDQCSKQFSTKQALQVHGRLHTGEKPFSCQVCGEKFRYRHFLRTHVNQKHQQEGFQDLPRPYRKNSDCGSNNGDGPDDIVKSQSAPSQLLGQNGESGSSSGVGGGFVCSQCSKSFSTKQAMQVHFRTHTGEKPFECQVCGERFRYRHVLRSHVNSRHEQDGIRDEPRPYNKRNNKLSSDRAS